MAKDDTNRMDSYATPQRVYLCVIHKPNGGLESVAVAADDGSLAFAILQRRYPNAQGLRVTETSYPLVTADVPALGSRRADQ